MRVVVGGDGVSGSDASMLGQKFKIRHSANIAYLHVDGNEINYINNQAIKTNTTSQTLHGFDTASSPPSLFNKSHDVYQDSRALDAARNARMAHEGNES